MLKNEFEDNLDTKNIEKMQNKYVLNPNSTYENTNKFFKHSNLIDDTELNSSRKFKIVPKNDIEGSQSSNSYKFRDYQSENNKNENFSSRANYNGDGDQKYRSESNKKLQKQILINK